MCHILIVRFVLEMLNFQIIQIGIVIQWKDLT